MEAQPFKTSVLQFSERYSEAIFYAERIQGDIDRREAATAIGLSLARGGEVRQICEVARRFFLADRPALSYHVFMTKVMKELICVKRFPELDDCIRAVSFAQAVLKNPPSDWNTQLSLIVSTLVKEDRLEAALKVATLIRNDDTAKGGAYTAISAGFVQRGQTEKALECAKEIPSTYKDSGPSSKSGGLDTVNARVPGRIPEACSLVQPQVQKGADEPPAQSSAGACESGCSDQPFQWFFEKIRAIADKDGRSLAVKDIKKLEQFAKLIAEESIREVVEVRKTSAGWEKLFSTAVRLFENGQLREEAEKFFADDVPCHCDLRADVVRSIAAKLLVEAGDVRSAILTANKIRVHDSWKSAIYELVAKKDGSLGRLPEEFFNRNPFFRDKVYLERVRRFV